MKIRTKILVAPAAAIACTILLGATAIFMLYSQQSALSDIVGTRFAAFRFAARQAQAIDDVHAGAYRLFTWIGNLDDKKATQEVKALAASAEQVKAAFAAETARTDLDENEAAILRETAEQFGKYQKFLAQALDLATVDVNTGMAMMQTADQSFRDLKAYTVSLLELEDSLSQSRYEAAAAGFRGTVIAIVVVLLGALAVSAALSILMSRAIVRPLGRAIVAARDIAQGDLTRDIDAGGNDETADLLGSMKDMQHGLRGVVQRISASAADLSAAAKQLCDAATEVAASSGQQSESAASTASSVEQVSTSIALVSDSAAQARAVAETTVQVADEGLARVQRSSSEIRRIEATVADAAGHIGELQARSSQIGSIANVIKDIADQTNLLALNAAIEAARAGEQGRGFAVVADEVRKLAEKTSHATSEIKTMIEAIQSDTEKTVSTMSSVSKQVSDGVAEMDGLVSPLTELNDSARTGLSSLTDLSAATREQNQASQEISRNVESIARMADMNGVAAKQSAAAAQNLSQLAADLLGAVKHFKS